MHFDKKADESGMPIEYRHLKLTVTRAGAVAYDRAVKVSGCAEPYCLPGGYKRSSVQVADLDGNGEPEVILDVYTGGAHCCVKSLVLSFDGAAYRSRTHDWRDIGYELTDAEKDAKPEFVSADARFAYKFASFAGSGFPVQIWNFDPAKGFTDATLRFKDSIVADRDRFWRSFRKQGRRGEQLGQLAAWAADEYRLGHRRQALAKIRGLVKAHKLSGGIFDLGKYASKFPGALDRFLKRLGYV